MNLKKLLNEYKGIFFFLIVEIVLVTLFLPKFKKAETVKENDIVVYTPIQKTCRFDIYNYGKESNKITIKNLSDSKAILKEPTWMHSDKGQGVMLQSVGQSLDFTLDIIGNGNLLFKIRGIEFKDKSDNKRRIPVCIALTVLNINGINILEGDKIIWHDSPFEYKYNGKDGEQLKIHAEWKPFVAE